MLEIIEKQALSRPITWPIITVGCIVIAGLIVLLCIIGFKKNANMHKAITSLGWIGGCGIAAILVATIICSIWFRIPTGTYRYEVKLNPDIITISQLENFKDIYKPESRSDELTYIFVSSENYSETDIINSLN